MRSRNIKPGFFRNEKLGELQPITRLFFAGLWCVADFRGNLEWRPKRIKTELLPYDDGIEPDVLLTELIQAGFVIPYTIDGCDYVNLPTFSKHQHPHKNERDAGTNIPILPDGYTKARPNTVLIRSNDGAKTEPIGLIPDSRFLIPDSRFLKADSFDPLKDSFNTETHKVKSETWTLYLECQQATNANSTATEKTWGYAFDRRKPNAQEIDALKKYLTTYAKTAAAANDDDFVPSLPGPDRFFQNDGWTATLPKIKAQQPAPKEIQYCPKCEGRSNIGFKKNDDGTFVEPPKPIPCPVCNGKGRV